jgi:membrane-bound lytic murein transglycosylase F
MAMNSLYKITLIFTVVLCGCSRKQNDRSLERIFEQNELTVLIRANSSDYFIHRGFPMGFQLELTQLFADFLDVNLRLVATTESEVLFQFILDEKIDIIASNITITETDKNSFCFTPFETERNVAWGILCDADSLRNVVIPWIYEISQTRKFRNLCLKYHIQPRASFFQCDTTSQIPGRLSPFDNAIKKYAQRLNWDWRLLASLIYQESNFFPDVVSWAGAIGLMQLMPDVAEKYGITEKSRPEEHILAGVKHLEQINKILPNEIPEEERIPFMLATYNVGLGHILDARRLAVLNDKDPNVWFDNVELELLKKQDRTIVRDSIIRHGYARGQETVDLVRDVMERWQHYQNLLP